MSYKRRPLAAVSNDTSDPHRTLRALRERNVRLELETADLCFLAALHLKARDGQLSAFDEPDAPERHETLRCAACAC